MNKYTPHPTHAYEHGYPCSEDDDHHNGRRTCYNCGVCESSVNAFRPCRAVRTL